METDITWLPFEHLRLEASGSYDEAFFGSFANAPCSVEASVAGLAVCDLSGRPLPYAPKWIGNVTAEYSVPLGSGNELYGVGIYSYRSGSYLSSDFTDSNYSWGDGYGVTNLRLGARVGTHWDVSVFSTTSLTSIMRRAGPPVPPSTTRRFRRVFRAPMAWQPGFSSETASHDFAIA